MDIDAEAREDLALDDADAENVIGGSKKKAHKVSNPAHSVGHSLPPIISQGVPMPTAASDPGVSSDDSSADNTDPDDC